MSTETRQTNFEINYGNYKFTFINKFKTVQDVELVFLISTDTRDSTKIKELMFARSRSECGFWRLCTAKPDRTGDFFYMEKGANYTMSSFIIIELQLYLNSILNELPIDNTEERDKFCQLDHIERFYALNNPYRMIDDNLRFDTLPRDEVLRNIMHIGDYNYEGSYNNFYQVDTKDPRVLDKLNDYGKAREEETETLREELKTIWPSNKATEIINDVNINYGKTRISIDGKIYSIVFKDYILYYMIYNCKIDVPEDINKYQDDNTNYEYHAESLEATQLIIPIYIIPAVKPWGNIDFTMYGLYTYYCKSLYKGEQLKTTKFLEYIQQCRPPVTYSYGPEPRGIPKPTCTTEYKFMGYYFDAIPFFSMIKTKTLENIASTVLTVGGKQKYIKQQ